MKKCLLFSTLILPLILIIGCSSSPRTPSTRTPAPVSAGSSANSVTPSQPAVNNPAGTAVNQPQPGGVIQNGAYNRHSSGIILNGAVYYTVIEGDTLNDIARRMYQDGSLYPIIMMVSGNVIDPDLILPKQEFIIPALGINMSDATARQSINRYFLDIAKIEEQRGRTDTAELIRNHTR